MPVRISIEATQPLTVRASATGKEAVAFVGWLELRSTLAEPMGPPEQAADPGREVGKASATRERRGRTRS